MSKATRQKLDKLIGVFLQERRKSDGGYPEVTELDIQQLWDIVQTLADMKAERDCDGDQVIEFGIYSRHEYEPLHYQPVPYAHARGRLVGQPETFAKHLDMVSLNHSIASEAMACALRMLQYDYELTPKKKK